MQVIAIKDGFYAGSRRRVGDVFDIKDEHIKQDKDGNVTQPKWVKPALDANKAKQEAAKVKKEAADKAKAGAVVASGGAAAKAKVDEAQSLAG